MILGEAVLKMIFSSFSHFPQVPVIGIESLERPQHCLPVCSSASATAGLYFSSASRNCLLVSSSVFLFSSFSLSISA
jgi:hypothetical protein